MYLQQSLRQQTSVRSMLRYPMSTMHQQERKCTIPFPRQAGTTRFPGPADVPRFPRQVGDTRFPRQAGAFPRYQHTQQKPTHVQLQSQSIQNIRNRTNTEDGNLFLPYYFSRDY
jgi:hypothetical protein